MIDFPEPLLTALQQQAEAHGQTLEEAVLEAVTHQLETREADEVVAMIETACVQLNAGERGIPASEVFAGIRAKLAGVATNNV